MEASGWSTSHQLRLQGAGAAEDGLARPKRGRRSRRRVPFRSPLLPSRFVAVDGELVEGGTVVVYLERDVE